LRYRPTHRPNDLRYRPTHRPNDLRYRPTHRPNDLRDRPTHWPKDTRDRSIYRPKDLWYRPTYRPVLLSVSCVRPKTSSQTSCSKWYVCWVGPAPFDNLIEREKWKETLQEEDKDEYSKCVWHDRSVIILRT